jgi:hypothetical protein
MNHDEYEQKEVSLFGGPFQEVDPAELEDSGFTDEAEDVEGRLWLRWGEAVEPSEENEEELQFLYFSRSQECMVLFSPSTAMPLRVTSFDVLRPEIPVVLACPDARYED